MMYAIMAGAIILSNIMFSVVMLSVITLSVIALCVITSCFIMWKVTALSIFTLYLLHTDTQFIKVLNCKSVHHCQLLSPWSYIRNPEVTFLVMCASSMNKL